MRPEREPEFEAVFREEYPKMVNLATLVTGDLESAKEVAQEAFASTSNHWTRVSAYDKPGAWLRRVTIRAAIKTARRDDRRRKAEEIQAVDRSREGSRDEFNGLSEDLTTALRSLSPHQRAAVALYYLSELTVAEVAVEIGCSQATAKVHLHRGRNRLADIVGIPDVREREATE